MILNKRHEEANTSRILSSYKYTGGVDFSEYVALGSFWNRLDYDKCGSVDLICDGNINAFDLQEFTGKWLGGDQ